MSDKIPKPIKSVVILKKNFTARKKIKLLRQEIEEGINSGQAENFNPKDHLKILKTKRK